VEAIDLNDMPYAYGARYVQDERYHHGTHESLLSDIQDILKDSDPDAPQLCLLTGTAGSGKSSIAHSIAQLYDEQKRLGSSYCFSKTDLTIRNPQNLFSTIARDLCDHDPQFKSALWGVVKDNRALRTSTSPLEQLERFIIEPSKHLDPIGPLIVVIDALDECGDPLSRQPLLRAISKQVSENALPRNLRLLITTRPESDILSALPSGPYLVHKQMDDEVSSDVDMFGGDV
jgi:energy-coupling factor transporter ATP-binding protein EcfA2